MIKYYLSVFLIFVTCTVAFAQKPTYKANAEACRGEEYVNLNELFITNMGGDDWNIEWYSKSQISEVNKIKDPTKFSTPQTSTVKLYLGIYHDNDQLAKTSEVTLKTLPSPAFKAMNDTTICLGNSVTLKFKELDSDITNVKWQNLVTNQTYNGETWTVTPNQFSGTPGTDDYGVQFKVTGESSSANICSNLEAIVSIKVQVPLIDAQTKLTTDYTLNKGIINLNDLLVVEAQDVQGNRFSIKKDSPNPPLISWNVTWPGIADPANYMLTADVELSPVINIEINMNCGNKKTITSQKIKITATGESARLYHESVDATPSDNKYPKIVCIGDEVFVKVLSGATDKIKSVQWIEPSLSDANKTEVSANEWHYKWDIGENTKFRARITLESGIIEESEITINVREVPKLVARTDTAACSFPVVLTNLLNANSYTGTVTWTPSHPATGVGTYTARATAKYQCQSMLDMTISGTVTVMSIDGVTLKAMDNTGVCEGDQVVLKAEVTGGNKIEWSTSKDGAALSSTVLNLPSGIYKYYVRTASACGTVYDSVTITVSKPPLLFTVISPTSPVCEGEKVTLKSGDPLKVDSILWKIDGVWYNQMEIEIEPKNTPTYLARGYKGGCYMEIPVTITTVVTPNLSVDDVVTACLSMPLTLTATSTTPGAVITWTDNAGHVLPNNTVLNNPVDGMVYTVEASVGGACSMKKTVQLKVVSSPSVVAMNDTIICYGEPITLRTLSHEGNISWNVPDITFVPTSTAVYTVIADLTPCGVATDNVTVTVRDQLYIRPEKLPTYKAGSLYDVSLETNAIGPNFSIVDGNMPFGFSLSSWGAISGSANTGEIGSNKFTVELVDAEGCTAQKEYSITEDLNIPEVFSPNGDGINDYFMVGINVVIFDRFGVKIFEGDNGWDGTYNGNKLPPDTYFYVITTVDSEGKKKKNTGSITIIGR